ncbi:kinase-like domain-containing protein [Mycotypha africana]|uniref:kinase-like domain-containing protein n=1 Tax=Mycotypha africana TaxID=64632 RepID=UPI0023003A43|nr:kinase-like domain-containing protein [Mycotypha africana]KAI8971698.1 kinase-like domain-containing protein [Mycotypha africana]
MQQAPRHQQQSRIPEQQGVGQILPPVPVGIDTANAPPLPPGAMPPGTRLQVGKYHVIVHNFIAEGGFAHVYLARIEGKTGYVVLKRVAVPDGERLKMVEKEIAFMRRLGDHKNIVRYYESRIDALPVGGFEALILMEYCPGGGVIDLMNRRLQQRLTEPEILKIFNDVAEALAYMHYCNPPVLHRDLKVENILILSLDHYKLCDFGSAALSKGNYIPVTLKDMQKIEDDIQRHTTLQYRAPEMIDVYQKKPINEKADIWAMGVLLYKLCYYTTPFEEEGQLAILNARYSIPTMPLFSDGLRQLIISMLQEDQNRRPNIYQVLKAVCQLRGVECPVRDFYVEPIITPNYGQAQSNQPQQSQYNSPSANTNTSSDNVIFEKIPPPAQEIPHITPMRRGRPVKPERSALNNDTTNSPAISNSNTVSPNTTSKNAAIFDPFDPNHVSKNANLSSGISSPAPSSAPTNSFQNSFTPTSPIYSTTAKSSNIATKATTSINTDKASSEVSDTMRSPSPSRAQSAPIIEEPKPQMATRILLTQPSTPITTTTTTESKNQHKQPEHAINKKEEQSAAKPINDRVEMQESRPEKEYVPETTDNSSNSARLSRSVSASIEERFMAIKNASRNNHQSIKTSTISPVMNHSSNDLHKEKIDNTSVSTVSSQEPPKKSKPAPPPKPARFRSASNAKAAFRPEENNQNNTPSVDDFEHKFPSLEDLDKAISSP